MHAEKKSWYESHFMYRISPAAHYEVAAIECLLNPGIRVNALYLIREIYSIYYNLLPVGLEVQQKEDKPDAIVLPG